MAEASRPSAEDLERMRDETIGNVDFDVTDEQLRLVWRTDPHLVALAREWGWNDTEARDQLCARLEELGAPQLGPGQSVTVGLRIRVATYPHRRAENPASAPVGELADLVEGTIVRAGKVRAAGAAIVMALADRPAELPPLADTVLSLRVDVTVTPTRWPGRTATPPLSEQVRGYLAAELATAERLAGAGIDVDVVSLVHGGDRNAAQHG